MLQQVLDAIAQADGPVELSALSRRLGIDRDALDGMIAFWVRRGRLLPTADMEVACTPANACACSHCPLTTAESCAPPIIRRRLRLDIS